MYFLTATPRNSWNMLGNLINFGMFDTPCIIEALVSPDVLMEFDWMIKLAGMKILERELGLNL